MKINEKLFLILLTIIVVFVLVACMIVLHLLQSQTEREKLEMYYGTLKQVLLSYEYVTDDIERYVFDRCRSEEIASCINQAKNPVALSLQLKAKIDSIVGSSPYLRNGFLAEMDGDPYFGSLAAGIGRFSLLNAEGFFDTNKDILWRRDGEGNLYLRRNIYQVYPYKAIAYSVFEIDQDYLRALTGMDGFTSGDACVIDDYGGVILMTPNHAQSNALFDHLIGLIREQLVLPRMLMYERTDYRVIAVNGTTGAWNAIYAVKTEEMLAPFYRLRQIILIAGGLLIAGAAIVSYLVSYTFTGSIRRLRRHINDVRSDDLHLRIPDMGRDEIGELAGNFNGLLGRLDQVYHIMLKEMQDKQQAKYELLEFKYRSLQSQISPHFLCNILSSISLLSVSGDINQVEKLAIDAGKYLRSNLKNNDRRYHTLQEEMRLVREYLNLVNAISAVPIRLTAHYPSDIGQAVIPNMILQPLVENSIKHGIPPQITKPFRIDIYAQAVEDQSLRLIIQDNGIGYKKSVLRELKALQEDSNDQPKLIGFGTMGVIRRLALQYGTQYKFEIENAKEGGAITKITLPWKT